MSLITVYSDRTAGGWQAEAVLEVGPLRRQLAVSKVHDQAPAAEEEVARKILDALTILLVGDEPETYEAAEEDED